jgi:hypothetical protein
MIIYLRHQEIDKVRWDSCIASSVNRRVYAFSWYLDLSSPGWDALLEDDYSCVFPLTHKCKWGISYLAQPFFSQQLGIFSAMDVSADRVSEFIRAIPARFRYAEIQLNAMNSVAPGNGEIVKRSNYELYLGAEYAQIAGSYSQNTRRNIRKAKESGVTIDLSCTAENLVHVFRENFGRKEGKLADANYCTITSIINHGLANKMGYILAAGSGHSKHDACAFFMTDRQRVYFLFAASTPEARNNGAMFFLIDHFIAHHAGKGLTVDFEGGNDPNLGRFYGSFGASETTYPLLKLNRLSKVANAGLYFFHKLRK